MRLFEQLAEKYSKPTVDIIQKETQEQQRFHLTQAHFHAWLLQIQHLPLQKLKVEDVLSFLSAVKLKFANCPISYCDFLDLLKECRSLNVDVISVIGRVCLLFQGYPDLIRGFCNLLPPGYNLLFQSRKFLIDTLATQQNTALQSNTAVDAEIYKEKSVLNDKECLHTKNIELLCQHAIDPSLVEIEVGNNLKESSRSLETSSVVSFLKNMKNYFNEKSDVYKDFIKISNSYLDDIGSEKDNRTKNAEFLSEVCKLFETKENLIEELKLICQGKETKKDKVSKFLRVHDQSIASIGKCGSLKELAFFDKVKRALNYHEVYDNFLRCLMLYNSDIITRTEVVQLVISFIGKFPELLKEFHDILGINESGDNTEHMPQKIIDQNKEKIDPDLAMDVDYSTGRKNGISYRSLPKNFEQPKCTGRSTLCREVLNDTWVSFPSFSEDSTFVSSCKTQYEEIIYRCEDERFELDIAVESNVSTIQDLDAVQKKINKMSQEEKSTFCLTSTLGGTSEVLNQRSLKRIYGDKTDEIVESLMKNPVATVPAVLKRLKAKEEEWKAAQAKFNDIWTEQNRNYYFKSLDHLGINFKQSDSKFLRSKSLLNEIETLYEERKEQIVEGSAGGSLLPHLILEYKDVTVLQDIIDLISQHTRQLPAIHREDRRRIEELLYEFIPDFFGIHRGVIPDDAIEPEETPIDDDEMSNSSDTKSGETTPQDFPSSPTMDDDEESDSEESSFPFDGKHFLGNTNKKPATSKESSNSVAEPQQMEINLPYNMFFVNNNWYLFFRQLHILCDRLCKLCNLGTPLANDPKQQNQEPNEFSSGSCSSRSGQARKANMSSTYPKLIDMVSNLLCGAMESTRFEDEARSMFGVHAYISFTMDKIVHNIVRQLQQIISDETCKRCTTYYVQHAKDLQLRGSMCPWDISILEAQYQKKIGLLLSEENSYKVMWHKREQQLTIELLDMDLETREEPCDVERWSDYVENFCTNEAKTPEEIKDIWNESPVYLNRNLLKLQRIWKNKLKAEIICQNEKFSLQDSSSKPLFPQYDKKRKRKCETSDSAENICNIRKTSKKNSASEVTDKTKNCDKIEESECKTKKRKLGNDCMAKTAEVKESSKHFEKNLNEPSCSSICQDTRSHKNAQSALVLTKAVEDANEATCSGINCGARADCLNEKNQSDLEIPQSDVGKRKAKNSPCKLETSSSSEKKIKRGLGADDPTVPHTTRDAMNSISTKECDCVISKEKIDLMRSLFGVDSLCGISSAGCGALKAENHSPVRKASLRGQNSESLIDSVQSDVLELMKSDDLLSPVPSSDSETSSELNIDVSSESKSDCSNDEEEFSAKTDKIFQWRNGDQSNSSSLLGGSEGSDFESEVTLEECQQLAMRNMDIIENTECKFSGNSYKMFFIARSESFMYRRRSFIRSRQVHRKVSKKLNQAFHKWHKIWLDRYVTPNMLKCCQDWLLRTEWCDARIACITENNYDKPPYHPYTRYIIEDFVLSD